MSEVDTRNILAGFMSGNAVCFFSLYRGHLVRFQNDKQHLYEQGRTYHRQDISQPVLFKC